MMRQDVKRWCAPGSFCCLFLLLLCFRPYLSLERLPAGLRTCPSYSCGEPAPVRYLHFFLWYPDPAPSLMPLLLLLLLLCVFGRSCIFFVPEDMGGSQQSGPGGLAAAKRSLLSKVGQTFYFACVCIRWRGT